MKKLQSLLLATLVMLAGCGEINDRLDALEGRVDAIENTQIATISQQITSINNSVLLLNNTDKELSEYITALEAEAENLQTQITATNTKIDEVKTEVLSTISTEKANILAELEALRNTTTTRLEEINATIAELKATDGDMSAQIEALEAEAAQLEVKLAETNTKIDTVKSELTETISTEKANILAELEAFKATVNGELDAIKAVLETLKAKDAELEEQIADLKEYVDSELTATEDWATATFATLEQYNEVVATIATVEGAIEGLNESISALETRINEKIAKDIETACATLSADLQNAVKDVTEAYTSAIATAKNELTEAYTTALEGAISALETSMKVWVNEQLTAYSTIVSTEAKITALQSEMDGKLAAQKTYLEALVNALSSSVTTDITAIRKQIEEIEEAIAKNAEEIEALRDELAQQKTELTEAYTAAIAAAIAESEGKMNSVINEEIEKVNQQIIASNSRYDNLVASTNKRFTTLEDEISQIKDEIERIKADVADLLNRVQSITYIPEFDDSIASVDVSTKSASLSFQIQPTSIVEDLAGYAKVQALQTQTRSATYIDMPIMDIEADNNTGIITLSISCESLSEDFYVRKIGINVMLYISDGNICISSDFIQLKPWDYTNLLIPNKNFKSYLVKNYDINGDGEISASEAFGVDVIDIPSDLVVSSLDGIEYFSQLTTLSCVNNHISAIDITHNSLLKFIDLRGNAICSIDTTPLNELSYICADVGVFIINPQQDCVVYANSATTCKVISANTTKAMWTNGVTWCKNIGIGWGMPSESELSIIYKNRSIISQTLTDNGYNPLDPIGTYDLDWYWASNEYNGNRAGVLAFSNGSFYPQEKNKELIVRAVKIYSK
ncbi:MAG: hypothetical protein J6U53_04400 [Tidjanibacter sp.]|nr:hypothetical protein [Tidjanibacter sp.]